MHEAIAIAAPEFQNLAACYPIVCMKTTGDIRHANLLTLIDRHGSIAALNVALGKDRTDATLSQIKNRSRDTKTQAPRAMGPKLARSIESALGLETGWMDHDHRPLQAGVVATSVAEYRLASLTETIADLARHLSLMDAGTRRKAMLMVTELEHDPQSHRQIAAAIDALVSTAKRLAA